LAIGARGLPTVVKDVGSRNLTLLNILQAVAAISNLRRDPALRLLGTIRPHLLASDASSLLGHLPLRAAFRLLALEAALLPLSKGMPRLPPSAADLLLGEAARLPLETADLLTFDVPLLNPNLRRGKPAAVTMVAACKHWSTTPVPVTTARSATGDRGSGATAAVPTTIAVTTATSCSLRRPTTVRSTTITVAAPGACICRG